MYIQDVDPSPHTWSCYRYVHQLESAQAGYAAQLEDLKGVCKLYTLIHKVFNLSQLTVVGVSLAIKPEQKY